jgi:hypothetical protein
MKWRAGETGTNAMKAPALVTVLLLLTGCATGPAPEVVAAAHTAGRTPGTVPAGDTMAYVRTQWDNAIDIDTSTAPDDTFSCFDQFTGPVVKKFTGDQGHFNFALKDFPDYARIDARGAIFRQEHYLRGGTNPRNEVIILLGGAFRDEPRPPLCWVGGRFIGSTALSATYRQVKNNGGAGLSMNSNGGVIDGVRMHNIHEDAMRLTFGNRASARPHKHRILRNSWISYTKASYLENDHVANLIVDDVLVDGSFNGLSVDPGAKYGGSGEQNKNEVIIKNALFRLLKVPDSRVSSNLTTDYLIFIKTRRPIPIPQFKIHNTIFATDGWPDSEGQSIRQRNAWDHTVECSNNVVAWLSDAPIPSGFPMPPSRCFKVVKGQEARDLWNAAKQNWINCHPKVEHIPGDPAANPSQCDPNAYGSGSGGSGAPGTMGMQRAD